MFNQTVLSRLEGGKRNRFVLDDLTIALVPGDEVMGGCQYQGR
jgi:hypothetical protein